MTFKTWKEARWNILAYTVIPIVVGGLCGIPHRGWVQIWKFLWIDNQNWTLCTVIWLFMMGIICLFAEANNQKTIKVKRIVGCAVVTLWIWGVTISGLYDSRQAIQFKQHISPPSWWWKGRPLS